MSNVMARTRLKLGPYKCNFNTIGWNENWHWRESKKWEELIVTISCMDRQHAEEGMAKTNGKGQAEKRLRAK
jgi:hypothetical protein